MINFKNILCHFILLVFLVFIKFTKKITFFLSKVEKNFVDDIEYRQMLIKLSKLGFPKKIDEEFKFLNFIELLGFFNDNQEIVS